MFRAIVEREMIAVKAVCRHQVQGRERGSKTGTVTERLLVTCNLDCRGHLFRRRWAMEFLQVPVYTVQT